MDNQVSKPAIKFNKLALISMLIGNFAILYFIFSLKISITFLAGIIAIIMGSIALKRNKLICGTGKLFAITGIVLGAIGVFIPILILILVL